ncbi:uncharacterized protein LOC110844470 [Folsomia candida]|uniref:Synaptotagmin-3 n=1 Tax=Folsomia candida TaxID=158441 RepID=A0A226EVP0_FOLCA|nr:uncharacterized protein LOC110844470 [Folsomia candida]OXA61154.1 Synaptotagmin-3 [Folsomia candida]
MFQLIPLSVLGAFLLPNIQAYPQQLKTAVTTENLYFVLSATNLPFKDVNKGVADPFAKVYYGIIPQNLKKNKFEGFDRIGTSEKLSSDANPKWNTVFKLPYEKGSQKKLWIEIRDHDPINPDDLIGDAFITPEEYLSHGGKITVPIWDAKNGTNGGSVKMEKTEPFSFVLEIKNVPHLDEFDSFSDPYVKCYFLSDGEEGKGVKFYETPPLQNVEHGGWEIPIRFDNYMKGTRQSLRFKVKDSDAITSDDDIGEAVMEIDQFVESRAPHTLSLSNSNNASLIVRYWDDK